MTTTLESRSQSVREYHLTRFTRHGEKTVELEVAATPIQVKAKNFTIFAVKKIGLQADCDLLSLARAS